jgi:glutaminyl-peptide cyclotransferase
MLRFNIVSQITRSEIGFTQGLEVHDDRLYESTGRIGGTTRLNLISFDGKVTRLTDLGTTVFGEGLTILKDEVFQLTWQEHQVFVYDLGGKIKREMHNPRDGWGLSNDGTDLIFSDGGPSIYYADPRTFVIRKSVRIRTNRPGDVEGLNELELVGGKLFGNIFTTRAIVRLDPASGCIDGLADLSVLWQAMSPEERAAIDSPESVLNGIAYDAKTGLFYLTGNNLYRALHRNQPLMGLEKGASISAFAGRSWKRCRHGRFRQKLPDLHGGRLVTAVTTVTVECATGLARTTDAGTGAAPVPPYRCFAFRLLRRRWEHRELADVALVMLDDDGGFEVSGDLLEAVQRAQCVGVVGVEHRNAVGVVVLPEVREVTGEQHVTLLLQLHQQDVMAWRMPGRVEHDDGAVVKHVLVPRHRFHLAAALDPGGERRGIGPGVRLGGVGQLFPVALADQERGFRKQVHLTNVVAIVVADADILDVVRLQLQLGEQLGDGFLRRHGSRTLPEAGIPHHVVVAMLDQVAAEYELDLQSKSYVSEKRRPAPVRAPTSVGAPAVPHSRRVSVTSGAAAGAPCARAEMAASAFAPMPIAGMHSLRCMISSHNERKITKFPIGRPMLPGCSSWVNV